MKNYKTEKSNRFWFFHSWVNTFHIDLTPHVTEKTKFHKKKPWNRVKNMAETSSLVKNKFS